ncbi:MAG: secondary thiamine-phosphate synthase enzyme YjbQ [Desulfatibacillaceae bacterium]
MIVNVKTQSKTELVDITRLISDAVSKNGMTDGICMVYVPHTTAAVTINEGADPAVREDIINALDEIVPRDMGYKHAEGNSPAHVKATIVGASELVAVENGRLVLGTWQSIFFCEFDGPRSRKVHVRIL